jgi:hypothetical protein
MPSPENSHSPDIFHNMRAYGQVRGVADFILNYFEIDPQKKVINLTLQIRGHIHLIHTGKEQAKEFF